MPNKIEEKTVAYVRITHEPCYVLSIEGDIAHCRRGVIAQTGSYYVETDFTLGELQADDPNRVNFEQLFKNEEGEVAITSTTSDSLLQN